MYKIKCCKCGKVAELKSINNLNYGRTYTKKGYFVGMTTNKLINGIAVETNDKKYLLVCCESCYNEWRLLYNSNNDWHDDFFNKFLKRNPFIFR